MSDTREKLIELITGFYGVDPMYYGVETQPLVDHLIANSVTIQKWIPVTERLPEEYDDVLCYRGSHIGALIDVYTYRGDNKWEDAYGYFESTEDEGITHWMPLPEPPKED